MHATLYVARRGPTNGGKVAGAGGNAMTELGDAGRGALRELLVPARHGSMTDAVTDALREAILSGVLQQQMWLREGDLAEAMQVSRTPVREALRRLSDEGLTQRVANRGTVVAPVSSDEILAVYAVRASLEGLAARGAASLRSPELIEELWSIHAKMEQALADRSDLAVLNLEFHRRLRDAVYNPYLERFLVQIENAVRRFGATTFEVSGRPQEALEEHRGIIEAVALGDEDLAEARATAHMRNAREVRLRQMLAGAGRYRAPSSLAQT